MLGQQQSYSKALMSYHYVDPCPDRALHEIMPIITRARSWLARTANELPHDENIQVGGAVFMLSGMEYHFAAMQVHLTALLNYIEQLTLYDIRWKEARDRNESFSERPINPSKTEQEHLIQISHDAVAYINRLGQFTAFAKAKAVKQYLVRGSELLIFRNKHSAHRSIDDPRNDDDEMSMWSQAASMGGFYVALSGGEPVFQMPDSKGNWQEFNFVKDHPVLLLECMAALEAISPAA